MSKSDPITTGSGQTFFWQMSLPEGAEINTANSNINYKMKFVFNCKSSAFGTAESGPIE